jgi:uncharacterized protein
MPHQCVRCSKLYEEGSPQILTGCDCGSKLFYYVRKDQLDMIRKDRSTLSLSDDEKKKIEDDIYQIIGHEVDRNIPVILDIESVKVIKPGSFELDLVNLFNKKQPLVYRLEEGKYVVDLVNSLYRSQKKKQPVSKDEVE